MVDGRFPRSRRLLRKADFDEVIRRGVRVSDGVLRLRALARGEEGPSRLGITVGRKAGKAVVRNRFKRLVREAFRLSRSEFPEGLDIVVFPARQRGENQPRFEEVEESLVALAARAGDRLRVRPRSRSPRPRPAAEGNRS